MEDLPVVRKIGDVIRIHRATVRTFKEQKQFNVNMVFNSSWCLFHSSDVNLLDKAAVLGPEAKDYNLSDESDEEMETVMQDGTMLSDRVVDKHERKKYAPYKFSGKSYSFDFKQEKVIVDALRNWEDAFFQKSAWIFKKMSKPLGSLKNDPKIDESKEFDLLVKILKIFEKDDYSLELRIKDLSNEMWFIVIPKLKFGVLREGDIIRIRSVLVNITSKRNVISCKNSTNILRFTHRSAIVRELREKVEDETATDKLMLEDSANEVIMSPVCYTEITDPESLRLPLFKLDDLFLNFDSFPLEVKKRNAFRVRFYALRIDPQDPREVVQALDPETKETFSC
mmetsp:Transcript_4467/g.7630  ORF Transcript_4467/g.7630 Transcript_4467/m.7630 type:complete len:339 (+) Transcript_4467:146-1162(+)